MKFKQVIEGYRLPFRDNSFDGAYIVTLPRKCIEQVYEEACYTKNRAVINKLI